MAELEAEAREKAEKEQIAQKEKAEKKGKQHRPRKTAKASVPKDKSQRNFTDMESRIMRNSDKAFIQGYNCQIAVDAETHVIVASDISNQAADVTHLPPVVSQAIANLSLIHISGASRPTIDVEISLAFTCVLLSRKFSETDSG